MTRLDVPCPWCGAEAGQSCTVIAAHPTTGRRMSLAVDPHPDRIPATPADTPSDLPTLGGAL